MVDKNFVSSSNTSVMAEFSMTMDPSGIDSTTISFSFLAAPLLDEQRRQKTWVGSLLTLAASWSEQKET
jgi:hypothetical protein